MTDLDAQAERQRLRAPEPGPEDWDEIQPAYIPPPSRLVGQQGKPTGWAILPFSFWVTIVILIVLAIYVNPWILWIGLGVYGLYKAFTAKAA